MYPENGFNRNQLPYTNAIENQVMPTMCAIVDATKYDFIECEMKAEGVQVVKTGGQGNFVGYFRYNLPKFGKEDTDNP